MNPGVPLLHFQHILLISWAFLIHKHGTWVWREICEKSVHVRGCNEDVTHNEGTEDPFNLQDFMKPPESFTSNIVSLARSLGNDHNFFTFFLSIGGGFNLSDKTQCKSQRKRFHFFPSRGVNSTTTKLKKHHLQSGVPPAPSYMWSYNPYK